MEHPGRLPTSDDPDGRRQQRAELRQGRDGSPPLSNPVRLRELSRLHTTEKQFLASPLPNTARSDAQSCSQTTDTFSVASNQQELQRSDPEGPHIEEQQATDRNEKRFSPLEKIKMLEELLQYIPVEYHKIVRDADKRARKAFNIAAKNERKTPEELVNFVKNYYNVDPHKTEWRTTYFFDSKEHIDDNHASIEIIPSKGIMSSGLGRHKYKDGVYFSDLQRYACITDDYKEIPLNEYNSQRVDNDNTLKIAKALRCAHKKLDSGLLGEDRFPLDSGLLGEDRFPLDVRSDVEPIWGDHSRVSHHPNLDPSAEDESMIEFTSKSAAFMVFLGADVNLSKIFLARDLGRCIQRVSIPGSGVRFQLGFVSAE